MAYMFVPRRDARLPRARHGASAVGRRLGRRHPPADRRRVARAAGDDAAVPADRCFGMRHLYDWTHADVVAHDEVLQHKQLVPERAVLPRPRGDLLRRLERARRIS